MSDVVKRAADAADKIAELQRERAERLASADAHEHQAREDRKRATACKNEIGEWTTALNSLNVQRAVESAEAAAKSHEAKAAATAADLEKMKAEVAAELEKLKAANAASATAEPAPAA